MAELEIPANYGNAVFRVKMAGKTNLMTFTLGYWHPVPGTTAEDAAESLAGAINVTDGAFTSDFLGSTFTLQDVLVYQNDAGIITSAVQGIDATGAGGLAVPPVQCSLLARKTTSRVGRKFRGRWYVPNMFFAETDIDAMGNIAPTPFGILSTAFNTTVNELMANTVAVPCLLHSDGTTPTLLADITLQSKMATQRRRVRA